MHLNIEETVMNNQKKKVLIMCGVGSDVNIYIAFNRGEEFSDFAHNLTTLHLQLEPGTSVTGGQASEPV